MWSGSRRGSPRPIPSELHIGMELELRIVPFRTDADGTEVLTFAFAPVDSPTRREDGLTWKTSPSSGWACTPSVGSATSRPSTWAPRPSAPPCADAGVQWSDVQVAFGGSFEVDNPDAVISRLGLTGIPFIDVYNGCATAASALQLAADSIRSGQYDLAVAVGMDKHEPGAFTADPVDYAAPAWYGEIGHFLTTKFFGMKINRYMHDHGISHQTLARVAAKNFRNGSLNPNAFRRKPLSEDEILGSRMLNYPLTPVHVLRARRGCRRGRAVPVRPWPSSTRRRRSTCGPPRCAPAGTARSRSTPRGRPSTQDAAPDRLRLAAPPTSRPASAPKTST